MEKIAQAFGRHETIEGAVATLKKEAPQIFKSPEAKEALESDLRRLYGEAAPVVQQGTPSDKPSEPIPPKPAGIQMPSQTVSNADAKEGDQLGLFGEATKAKVKAPEMKIGEPTTGKQGGLFDTHGNADQMDLFGDAGMDSSMVYKPQAAAANNTADGIAKVSNDEFANGTWDRTHAGLASEAVQSKIAKGMEGIENREYAIREHSPGKFQLISKPSGKPQEKPAEPPQQPKDNAGNEFAPGVSYRLIPTAAAYDAHRNTSFVPEQRAKQRQEGFAHELNETYASLKRSAKGDESKLQTLDAEWPRYLERAKANYLAALNADSRTASTMITGGSNFNVSRNRKKLDAAQNKWEAYSEHSDKGEAAIWKAMHPELAPKKIGDSDTGGHIATKLDQLKKRQEQMKAANKAIKSMVDTNKTNREAIAYKPGHTQASAVAKLMELMDMDETDARRLLTPDYIGRVGYPSFELTNNNANIRRYEEQAEKQKRFEAEAQTASKVGEAATVHDFDGGKVHLDYEDNRIRIIHDAKPPKDVLEKLKSNGFRWSPSNKAWQRQLTRAAKYAAHDVTGVPLDKLTPKGQADE
jgi:hypothetical protein